MAIALQHIPMGIFGKALILAKNNFLSTWILQSDSLKALGSIILLKISLSLLPIACFPTLLLALSENLMTLITLSS
jgi:hypothetical protein